MPTISANFDWNAGARSIRRHPAPPVQVHVAAENTIVLRQSIALSAEAPFLYLLFGTDRALLLDTGATADAARFPLRETVDALVNEWLAGHPKDGYELVVAHSHSHADHIAADEQFADRPLTRTVGHSPEAVAAYFGIKQWPTETAGFDLGDRMLHVIPTPGHHAAAITIYDPSTGWLLTGDTAYPGRLYVADAAAFVASLNRLCDFVDTHTVTDVAGAHIEMSKTPRRDFSLGSPWHPNEADLALTTEQLKAVRDAAVVVAGQPGVHRYDDFAIWIGPCRPTIVAQVARSILFRLFGWF